MEDLRMEAQVMLLTDRVKDLEKENAALETNLKSETRRAEAAEEKIKQTIVEARDCVERWKTSVNNAKSKEHAAVEAHKATAAELAEVRAQLQAEQSDKDQKIAEYNATNRKNAAEIERLQAECTKLRQHTHSMEQEVSTAVAAKQLLEQEFDRAAERLKRLESQAHSTDESNAVLEKQVLTVQATVANLERQLVSANSECEKWKTDCCEAFELIRTLRHELKEREYSVETQFKNSQMLKEQVEKAEHELQLVTHRLSEATEVSQRYKEELDTVSFAKASATERVSQLEAELRCLDEELKETMSNMSHLKTQLADEKRNRERIQSENDALSIQLSMQRGETTSLHEDLRKANSAVADLTEKMQSLYLELESAQATVAETRKEVASLTTQVEGKSAEIFMLNGQLSDNMEEIARRGEENNRLMQEASEMEKKFESLRVEFNINLQTLNETLSKAATIPDLEQSIMNLNESLRERDDDLTLARKAQQQLEDMNISLGQEVDSLKEQTSLLSTLNSELSHQLSTSQSLLAAAEQQLVTKAMEINSLREHSAKELDALSSKAFKLESENTTLETKLHVLYAEMSTLHVQCDGFQEEAAKVPQLTTKLEAAEAKTSALSAEVEAQNTLNAHMKSEISALQQKLKDEEARAADAEFHADETKSELQSKLESLAAEHQRTAELLQAMQLQLDGEKVQLVESHKAQLAAMENALEMARSEKSALHAELNSFTQERHRLQTALLTEERSLAEATREIARLRESEQSMKDFKALLNQSQENAARLQAALSSTENQYRELQKAAAKAAASEQELINDLETVRANEKTLAQSLAAEQSKSQQLKKLFNELKERYTTVENDAKTLSTERDECIAQYDGLVEKYNALYTQHKALKAATGANLNSSTMNASIMNASLLPPVGGNPQVEKRLTEELEKAKQANAELKAALQELLNCSKQQTASFTEQSEETRVLRETVRVLNNRMAKAPQPEQQQAGIMTLPLNTLEGPRRAPKRLGSAQPRSDSTSRQPSSQRPRLESTGSGRPGF